MTTDLLFHNDCLTYFNTKLYDGVFTEEMVKSSKKSIKVGENKFYGYYFEKGRENYVAKSLLLFGQISFSHFVIEEFNPNYAIIIWVESF